MRMAENNCELFLDLIENFQKQFPRNILYSAEVTTSDTQSYYDLFERVIRRHAESMGFIKRKCEKKEEAPKKEKVNTGKKEETAEEEPHEENQADFSKTFSR